MCDSAEVGQGVPCSVDGPREHAELGEQGDLVVVHVLGADLVAGEGEDGDEAFVTCLPVAGIAVPSGPCRVPVWVPSNIISSAPSVSVPNAVRNTMRLSGNASW